MLDKAPDWLRALRLEGPQAWSYVWGFGPYRLQRIQPFCLQYHSGKLASSTFLTSHD